jgi:hypothetical protein
MDLETEEDLGRDGTSVTSWTEVGLPGSRNEYPETDVHVGSVLLKVK